MTNIRVKINNQPNPLAASPPAAAPTLSEQNALEVSTRVDSYKQAHIETATPERLVVMLYDGAIKFCQIAKQALGDQQFETAHKNILKTEAIILELMSVLDMEIGGELAVNLYNLYDFMYRHLIKANIQHDTKLIDEVIGLLEELRGAWNEAAEIVSQMRNEGKFEGAPAPGDRSFAG